METKQNGAVSIKKNKSCIILIVVLAAMFVMAIIAIGILKTFYPSLDPRHFLDILGKNSAVQKVTPALKVMTESSTAEIITGDGKTNLTLEPIEKKNWPKETIGGMFKLEPSGDFEKPVVFKMTLNKIPDGCFAIGYWHEDTKKWEFLPTINLGKNQYATILTHASNVGGGISSVCPSKFQDSENQQMSNAIRAELMKIQIDQQTGEAAKINDASWKAAWENSDELTNKVISDFCAERKAAKNFWNMGNTSATMDFLNGTQLMQCLGFGSLAEKYTKAMDTECGEKKKEKVYVIKQTDYIDTNIKANIAGGFYKQDMNSKTAAVTSGKTISSAKAGTFGWQTAWQVDTFYTTTFGSNSGIHIEKGNPSGDYRLLDIPMKGVTGGSTNVNRITFSLEGVKEGEAFAVKIIPIAPYSSSASGPTQKARGKIVEDGQIVWNYNQNFSPSWSETVAGKPIDFKATLLRNLGEKGALIKFSDDISDMGGKQGEQLKKINDLVKNAMPGGQNYYGIALPSGVSISQSGNNNPWIIKLDSVEENVNPEDDYKVEEDAMKNSQNAPANPINEGDKNGDGVPDVAPLPSPNDLNGDGIPDLVPLPGAKK